MSEVQTEYPYTVFKIMLKEDSDYCFHDALKSIYGKKVSVNDKEYEYLHPRSELQYDQEGFKIIKEITPGNNKISQIFKEFLNKQVPEYMVETAKSK